MKNKTLQKAFRWAISDQRLGEKRPTADRCQFCGQFHFGECEAREREEG